MAGQNSEPELSVDDYVVTLNPIVGVNAEDIARAATEVLQAAALQPVVASEYLMRLNGELLRVLFGSSSHAPTPQDRRFADSSYQSSPLFSRFAKAWLAWSTTMSEWIEAAGLEGEQLERARFVTTLAADSLAPSNFLLGNPAALRKAFETRGSSLIRGLRNFADDLRHNHGMPSQVDKSAFEVGRNLATSVGAVIHRDDILELIQYQPRTDRQHSRPLLIVPPQINKFYVYDMSPEKSMVGYLLDQGFQVFMISWRNPTAEHRSWGLDDYVLSLDGALDVTLEVAGADKVNTVGACAGGITLATALGYLAGRNNLDKVGSLTLMVNVLQPSTEDSVIGLFADDEAIETARKKSARAGVLDGQDTARIFNWMRPNDLIWNYVVSNYLLGETPPAFDILYWNNDTTRLPARLHSDFLDIFKDNLLTRQGELSIRGVPIDLKKVTVPTFVTGGTTDHITPWQACYRTTQLLGGDVTYILSTAGHIQSLINPPGASKRRFYTNPDNPASADAWRNNAEEHLGSWWPYWSDWLKGHHEGEIEAPIEFGNHAHPEIVAAPGGYVLE